MLQAPSTAEKYAKQRALLLQHLARMTDPPLSEPVLRAFERVPRHLFVPAELAEEAYENRPLPIGWAQTISQPQVVAAMTELVHPSPQDRVLEIGTGSGYQAAILAQLAREVYSVERIPSLAESASARIQELGYPNVFIRAGDGWEGWPEHAPFQVIVVTAAPEVVPPPLLEQLAPGGRMILPVGGLFQQQELRLLEKNAEGHVREQSIEPVVFVPFLRGVAEGP